MTKTELPDQYTLKTNNVMTKDLNTYVGLVFDGVLDKELLAQKYRDFIARWPIIGGTLITKTSPYSLTTGYLADVQTRHLDSILASIVPAACIRSYSRSSPTIISCSLEVDSIYHFNNITRLGGPHESLLSLRITTLKDATLLGFCMPHHAFDGTSSWDVIRYYCDFVNGKEIPDLDLPPDFENKLSTAVKGEDKNLPELEDTEIITDPNLNHTVGTVAYAKFIGQSLWKTFGPFQESEDQKFVYLPIELVEKWQVDCQQEIDNEAKVKNIQSAIHVTKNDVMTAYFYIMSFRNSTMTGNVNMGYAINIRPYLEDSHTLYIKNAFIPARVYFPSLEKLKSYSHAQMALYIHQNVQAYTQPSVMRATLKFWEEVTEKGLSITPIPVGGNPSEFGLVSSWTTFRYDELNLISALKNIGDADREQKIGEGNCIFTQPWVFLPGNSTVKPVAIIIRDGDKGFWLRANNSIQVWKAFEEASLD